jgi:serine/threonine protein kinase/tetratricopeptide (TPR) repeat protein
MIGRTIGQYKVVDKIGEGGMGSVWRAEDTTLGRLVALKSMSRSLVEDEEARERFIREAQSASSLNHPGITTVYELVEDEDTQLICMEYVEGKTIRDMVETGVVSVRKAIDIILQAAEALEAAHNKGILHRDIKSANIMVSMEGRVKVMDFGLAHLGERSELTRSGTTLGTLSYSCPEHLTGKTVDQRSEVWSLGVVFYELLTGQLPFKGPSEGELIFSIINNMPEKVSKLRDDMPELVEAVVTRMLEKDPELRYQGLGEVISDLSSIRKGMDTSTVSITGALEQMQAGRRKKLIARAGIGVVAAAVIAVGAMLLVPRGSRLNPKLVVVGLFENRTGDPELDHLSEITTHRIITATNQSQLIEVVFFDISSSLQERPEVQTSMRPHRSLAILTGAGTLVTGSFYVVDDVDLEFQVDIVDVRSDRLLDSLQPIRGPRDAPANLIQEVQERVSAALAIRFDPMLAEFQVSSPRNLDAYRAYLEGMKESSRSRWSSAVPNFLRAIEEDSTYAPAKIQLAIAYLNIPTLRALTAADSISRLVELQRDRLPILEALLNDWVRASLDGDREAAYRVALESSRQSSTSMGWNFLGQEAMKVNRLEQAISAYERIRLDSPFLQEWVPYWRRLIDTYNMSGQPSKALDAAERGLEMHPGNGVLRERMVYSLSFLGRSTEAQQILEAEFPLPGAYLTWRNAAFGLRARGFQDEARSIGRRMVEWYEKLPDTEREVRTAMEAAAYGHYVDGRFEEAERFSSMLNQEIPTSFNTLLGVLAARRDDREEAMEWSQRIEENSQYWGRYAGGFAQFNQACIAAQLGDLDVAMDLLREAHRRGRSYPGFYFWPELEPLQGNPQYEEFMRPKK